MYKLHKTINPIEKTQQDVYMQITHLSVKSSYS